MKPQLLHAVPSMTNSLRKRWLCVACVFVAATAAAATASPAVQDSDSASPSLPQGSALPSSLTLDTSFSGGPSDGVPGTDYYDGNNVDGNAEFGVRVFQSHDSGYAYLVGVHDHSVSGETNDGFIVRLNEDGSYDNTFGTGGKLLFSVPFAINDVAFDPSGNFYFAGDYYNSSSPNAFFGVYCVDGAGIPCAGFGTNGLAHVYLNINAGHPVSFVTHITYDLTGAVFVTGFVNTAASGNNYDVAIFKLNSTTGALVSGFGSGGGTTYGFDHTPNGSESPTALLLTYPNSPSGLYRLYVTGTTQINAAGTDYDGFVMAVDPVSGALDTSFAGTGVRDVYEDLGTTNKQDEIDAIVATRDGNIALAGNSRNDDDDRELLLAKIQPNGLFVAAFCDGGYCTNTLETLFGPYSHYEVPVAMAERNGSGDLVIGMTIHNDVLGAGEPLQAIAELPPSGTDWRALQAISYTSDNPSPLSAASDLKIDDSNRVLLAGSRYWSSSDNDWDMTLARMVDTDTIFTNGFEH